MVTLLAPEGIASIEANDGSIFTVPLDRRVAVHDAVVPALIEAGFTVVGDRPAPTGEVITYVQVKNRDGSEQGYLRVYGKFDPKPGQKGDTGTPGSDGGPGPKGDDGDEGPPGESGEVGPMPAHEWDGPRLRFQQPTPDGGVAWGAWANLVGPRGGIGPKGNTGDEGQPGPPGRPGMGGGGGTTVTVANSYFPSGW